MIPYVWFCGAFEGSWLRFVGSDEEDVSLRVEVLFIPKVSQDEIQSYCRSTCMNTSWNEL